MAVDIHKLIAAINPSLYCEEYREDYGEKIDIRDKVKETIKEKGFLEASKVAEVKQSGVIDFDKLEYKSAFSKTGLKNPIEKHFISYDSFGENLEPIYFWILDNLYSQFKDMKEVDKLVDNFASSAGSSHFSEIGQKATRMQEEAMKIYQIANTTVKTLLNLIYDLKEFEMLLDQYENLKDEKQKQSAFIYLKQRWMDTVDVKRGNTSIKALAQQFQYVTLIDAFMVADDIKKVESLDLNDRVRRILEQRIGEFLIWIKESEKELRKRYEIEKIYLRSQVNTLNLYTRWAKPYLRAAKNLEQRAANAMDPSATQSPALVTLFNTVIFELTLLGKAKYDPIDDVNSGTLPPIFKKTKLRKYNPLIIIELKFRSIPERAGQQGYGFRGKVEIAFTSYALRDDELKLLKSEIEKDDLGDLLNWIEGSTTLSLEQMKEDLDHFLEGKPYKKASEEKQGSNQEDTNPISALFSIFKSDKKKEDKSKKDKGGLGESDDDLEKVLRSQAILKARQECKKFYELYKKNHNMPTF